MTVLDIATLDGPPARPEPKRDRWGRYVITHPTTGKSQSWTRATTFASSVADTFGLTKWQLRMAAVGLAQRPDLFAQVASSIPVDLDTPTSDEKKKLDSLVEAAKEHAGTSRRANLGTALHSFCENADLGRPVPDGPWKPDVDAYRAVMSAAGVTILPQYVERIVTVPVLDVAGTFDRIVQRSRMRIADLKSGRDLSYSWGEIAIQLALYAHAETIYDPVTQEHEPMPDVDQDRALVMHVPAGTGTCLLYEVDIAAGWEMAQICMQVRNWRKRKNLATVLPVVASIAPATGTAGAVGERGGHAGASAAVEVTAAPTPPTSDDPTPIAEVLPQAIAAIAAIPDEPIDDNPRTLKLATKRAWLRQQYDELVKMGERGIAALQAHWPADVPTMRQADEQRLLYGAGQLAAIEAALKQATDAAGAPFEQPDPTDPVNQPVSNDDPRVVALIGRGEALPADLAKQVFVACAERELPSLRVGVLNEARLAAIAELVELAEAKWAIRSERIQDALDAGTQRSMLPEQALLQFLSVNEPRELTLTQVEHLEAVAFALSAGFLVGDDDGHMITVDAPAVFEAFDGSKQAVWDAARTAAKANGLASPSSADDAVSSPLLVALFCAT